MLTLQGYYDGTNVQLLEKTKILPNQKLIIMVTDEFVKKPKMTEEERLKKIKELGGSLSEYAIKDGRSIDEIMELESKAWEEAVVEKYGKNNV
jgi:phosphopantetheine adenylyltransferase